MKVQLLSNIMVTVPRAKDVQLNTDMDGVEEAPGNTDDVATPVQDVNGLEASSTGIASDDLVVPTSDVACVSSEAIMSAPDTEMAEAQASEPSSTIVAVPVDQPSEIAMSDVQATTPIQAPQQTNLSGQGMHTTTSTYAPQQVDQSGQSSSRQLDTQGSSKPTTGKRK
jgi:hypothetical protein